MSYFDDEEKRPLSEKLGNTSDNVFGFIFNPGTIKFGLLIFAGFCVFINISGYYDLIVQSFNYRLDEYGREVAINAPLGVRAVNALTRVPLLGTIIAWADMLTGNIAAVLFAIGTWFIVQGLEIAGRFNLYFPDATENLLYKQNRKHYEQPNQGNPNAKKAHRLATGHLSSLLRWITIGGVLVYALDVYVMHLSRPWLDTTGNPLWLNWFWNSLAVFGVEIALLIHLAYKHMTLTPEERADKNRYNQ